MLVRIGLCLLALLALGGLGLRTLAQDKPSPLEKGKSLKELMPRIPATDVNDALKTFQIERGFKLELVAGEPLVGDPVDACFDEFGRMYVAEFHGYPYSAEPTKLHPKGGGKKNDGIIRLLEDTDGDGKFEKSTVFADGFEWALSVCCYDGGVFVIGHPHLWYFKDTDGDGKADIRKIVLTGFGKDNVQSLANNMKWGLENRILVAGGRNPNTLSRDGKPVMSGTSDFAFDPKVMLSDANSDEVANSIQLLSGGEQFGHSTDDWGNRFVCNNSNHIQHIVLPRRYLTRNPTFVASGVIRSIGAEGAAAPVFRRSPPEPWRIVRTARRNADPKFAGLPQSEKVAAGFFTSATGVTIYRGGAYPEEFRGNAFVGDVGANLIHRKILTPSGPSFVAKRADEMTEFVSSTDNWFRPVNFVNAPDGTLFVLDMYRETIEHPASIPEDIKAEVDLESGHDRGRIWRLVGTDGQRMKVEPIGKLPPDQLIKQFWSPNSWNRETAQRLFVERGDLSVVPSLRRMAALNRSPLARLHCLYTLAGLNAMKPDVLMVNLKHPEPRLRAHVLRLAEPLFANDRELAEAAAERAADDSDLVRWQLAFSAGEMPNDLAVATLSRFARDPRNTGDIRAAMMTSLNGRMSALFEQLANDAEFQKQPHANGWLVELARSLGSDTNNASGISVLIAILEKKFAPSTNSTLMIALGEGLKRRGATLDSLLKSKFVGPDDLEMRVTTFLGSSISVLNDAGRPLAERIAAARMLAFLDCNSCRESLTLQLGPQTDPQLQLAAANSLGQLAHADVPKLLLAGWRGHSPALRREIVDSLLRSTDRVGSLLNALEAGQVGRGEIERDKKDLLANHPNSALRDRAKKLLAGEVDANRAKVIADYKPALETPGDIAKGKLLFQQKCSNCHQIAGVGHVVGPNLQSVANKSPADLLIAILDPNREAQPNFATYVVETQDGKVLNGLLVADTATSVTLRRAEAKEDVVLRSNIETIVTSGKSLMPEGFEKDIPPAAVADLLAYLKSLGMTEAKP
ncbi:MAG: c-type cytochrome [Planctomycetes bacterium]|nr:c-type cytochrome [Planctomycetota bacterium]